jgi:ferredoxin-NADP reductase
MTEHMKLKLINKNSETSDVISFLWEPEEPVEWKPGQFLHYVLKHADPDDRGDERWFTISSPPFEKNPTITTRFATEKSSSFKKALHNLQIGDSIEADSVDGDFTIDDPAKSMVFIAGGIGVTPYHSILKQLDHDGQPINVTLLYSNRNPEIVFKDAFEELAKKHDTFKVHYILSPQRIDEEIIRQFVPDLQVPIFYVSGPEPMVDALSDTLKKMGVPEDHIKGDWFPGYPME